MSATLEYIESYFEQQLSLTEKKAFEERCVNDEAFAKEVAFYISSREAMRQLLLDEKKKQWATAAPATGKLVAMPQQPINLRRWAPYAIAASLIIAVAVYFIIPTSTPEQLALAYVNENYSQVSQTMDASTDSLQLGIEAYNKKEYAKALQLLNGYYATHPNDNDALKLMGLTYLQQQKYDAALQQFETLGAKQGLFSNPGLFLQAVTLLQRNKEGDKEKARNLLEAVKSQNLEGSKQAEEWLKKW